VHADRKKTAVKTKPVTREGSFPGRVLAPGAGVSGRSGGGVPLAGKLIIAVVFFALAWPLVRAATMSSTDPDKAPVAGAKPAAVSSAAPARTVPGGAVADLGAPLVPGAQPVPLVMPPAMTAPIAADSAPAERPGAPAVPAEEAALEPIALAKAEPARNLAPRIVSHRPRGGQALSVSERGFVDFSVRATDRNPDDRLAYAWFVDGKKVGRGASWRFVAAPGSSGTAHTVEAQVADQRGLQAPRVSWKLEVTARMSEVDVREWLGRLAAAWERKDIATLRLYGLVTNDEEAEAVRKHLSREKDLRVSIGNEWIHTEGKYASVAFDVSELGKRGKLLASRRDSFELEKRPNGFVGLRTR
jgi:hypothetical protein